jgi:membrane-associated phospholipid phosphatase
MNITMHPRLAKFISSVGSPVLLFPLVISILFIRKLGMARAVPMVSTVCAIFAALSLFLLIRKIRGSITDLDVSDQKQRAANVFLPVIVMLLLAVGYFYLTNQPFVGETLYVGGLLGVCFAINAVKKISMHTVVAIYLSTIIVPISPWLGLASVLFSGLIAWSRIVLGRHTQDEVLLGWLVGTGFGLLHSYLF